MLGGIKHFIRRTFAPSTAQWPFVRGDYALIDPSAPVVVLTSGPDKLLQALVAAPPPGLCMTATLHSSNDAADLLRAIAANLAIQKLVCLESDRAKQPLGQALLKLGRDEGAPPGSVGSLMNAVASQIDSAELAALRRRVEFCDMLSCEDLVKLSALIEESSGAAQRPNAGFVTKTTEDGIPRLILPRNTRHETRLDKAGRFRIRLEEHSIIVDHLDGKQQLLRVIEGKTARDICLALIRNGWISKLDHAAYLGRELARAEAALRSGNPFVQDSAEPDEPDPPAAIER